MKSRTDHIQHTLGLNFKTLVQAFNFPSDLVLSPQGYLRVTLEHDQRPLKILFNIYYYNCSFTCSGTTMERKREVCILGGGWGVREGGREGPQHLPALALCRSQKDPPPGDRMLDTPVSTHQRTEMLLTCEGKLTSKVQLLE